MRKWSRRCHAIALGGLVGCMLLAADATAQRRRPPEPEPLPELKRIYFNLYTDSIKPVLNYYVNVEGEYADGRILPLDTATVLITADAGEMRGSEWLVRPGAARAEKVTFTAQARANPALRDAVTIWLKKARDRADEELMRTPEHSGPPR